MKNKNVIYPNLCTVGNLFCGFFAIACILNNDYIKAAWIIVLGTFFDALDGRIARITKGTSPFGMEFDSLADVITSGVAPTLLVYKLGLAWSGILGVMICFIPVFCGAFRLARYNVQSRESHQKQFTGMPIPLFALTIASYVIFNYDIWGQIRVQASLVPIMLFLSFLMVSTIPYKKMPNLSFRDVKKGNRRFWLYLIVCTALVLDIRKTGFPIVLANVLWGLFSSLIAHFRSEEEEEDKLADISL